MTERPGPAAASAAFAMLHPKIQRWVYSQGWRTLHDAQEQAIAPILAGDRDVVVCAPTAAGKTEAAFLPVVSAVAAARDDAAAAGGGAAAGVEVLCVSPLKALINDQFARLDELCEHVEVPVWRWHGDVASGVKHKLLSAPSGLLVITPESLEAIFVTRSGAVPGLFAALRYVVIDEMHVFMGTPRGAQVQSLLDRVERRIRRRVPRVALSATLADPQAARAFLRASDPGRGVAVEAGGGSELRMQMRGYVSDPDRDPDAVLDTGEAAAAGHIFDCLGGGDHLVFANTRLKVEAYADHLSELSKAAGRPNRFHPHHGNLSRDMRDSVEQRLKDPSTPTVAVCTSTLELGIDIGTARSVAQVGCPPSVAALRQRLGRSGRRDDPSVLRIYITEPGLHAESGLGDRLRWNVVQAAAMVELMLAGWLEAPDDPGFNYSTLIQQTLSTIAEHNGAGAAQLHQALCGPGPFARVDADRYARLLRAMASHDLITQTGDGQLIAGVAGEQRISHYTFYAAFDTPDEWKVVAANKTLGTVPVSQTIQPGGLIVFAGRRWQIVAVDEPGRSIEVRPAHGGRPPPFAGSEGAWVQDRVRRQMRSVYTSSGIGAWADPATVELLAEGRGEYRRSRLADTTVAFDGSDIVIVPFAGDRVLFTAAAALARLGLEACVEGPTVRIVDAGVDDCRDALDHLAGQEPPDGTDLAASMANRSIDKWDWVLDDTLSCESVACRRLDPPAAWTVLRQAATDLATARPAAVPGRRTHSV